LVEHQLPKLRVAGSSPVSRSGRNRGPGWMLGPAGALHYLMGVIE